MHIVFKSPNADDVMIRFGLGENKGVAGFV